MAFKMKGFPMKKAPVKTHESTNEPWKGHMTEKEFLDKQWQVDPSQKRGRVKFDIKTGKIIDSSLEDKETMSITDNTKYKKDAEGKFVLDDGVKVKLKPEDKGYVGPTITKTKESINREDQNLVKKYKKTMTGADATRKKLDKDISTGGRRGRNLKSKVSKSQKKFDNLDKELTNLSSQYDKINKNNPNDPRLLDMEKRIDKLTTKHGKVEDKLDRRKDKQWNYQEDIKEGKKVVKGNLFTRMKANRQERDLRNQRNYLNMSDKERHPWRQMNIDNRAQVIRRSGGGGEGYEIQTDFSEYMNPTTTNYKSFNEMMQNYQNMQNSTPLSKKKK